MFHSFVNAVDSTEMRQSVPIETFNWEANCLNRRTWSLYANIDQVRSRTGVLQQIQTLSGLEAS